VHAREGLRGTSIQGRERLGLKSEREKGVPLDHSENSGGLKKGKKNLSEEKTSDAEEKDPTETLHQKINTATRKST